MSADKLSSPQKALLEKKTLIFTKSGFMTSVRNFTKISVCVCVSIFGFRIQDVFIVISPQGSNFVSVVSRAIRQEVRGDILQSCKHGGLQGFGLAGGLWVLVGVFSEM